MAFRYALRCFGTSTAEKVITNLSTVEKVDSNLYRGARSSLVPTANGTVYGGQIVGQALMASSQTVSEWLHLHSIQCHFLRQGDPLHNILYFIKRPREGKNFSARFIKAVQDGECIFTARLSYHQIVDAVNFILKHTPCLMEHQSQMEDVPNPESLESISETSVEEFSPLGPVSVCFEQKPVTFKQAMLDAYGTPLEFTWVKARYVQSDDVCFKQCLTSQLSHSMMFHAALKPFLHGQFDVNSAISVDHCTWFHNCQLNFDDWQLCETGLSAAADNCGFSHFRLWSRDGQLLVTSVLECLIGEQEKMLANE